jgi:hypothetical protein
MMRWLAIAASGLTLLVPGAAEAVSAGSVASTTVRVKTAGVADVRVRCDRERPCRGVLSLSVPCDQRDEPVVIPACVTPVGARRFAIAGGRTSRVSVRRNDVRFTSAARDASTVTARVFVAGRTYRSLPRGRRLTLTARQSLPRPDIAPSLVRLDGFPAGDDGSEYELAFEADVPRGSFLAQASVAGRTVALHPAGGQPFVVPPGSWVPGGVSFHGTLRTRPEDLPPHSSQRITIAGCTIRGCTSATSVRRLPGPNDPRPICHIGLGPVSAPGRLMAGLPR